MNAFREDILLCFRSFGGDPEESRALLCLAAERYTKKSGDWTLAFGKKGKPFFPAMPQVHFSVTHSGRYWMCAFSGQNIGLDLQEHRSCDRRGLSARFFHPAEDAFLQQREDAVFFDLWAAKESYVKFTGEGITEGLDYFSVVAPDGRFPCMEGMWLYPVPWETGYSLCLCAREAGTLTITQL